MKAGPPEDSSLEANDPVWRLLAQAPRPEPDAWFAARTMARCRHEGLGQVEPMISANWFSSIGGMWRWAVGGGLALCLATAVVVNQIQTEKADKQKNVQEAFEIVASVDSDSDSSSSTSWQDSSL
jgi:hypothetical protein